MKTACIYHSVDLDGWMSAAIVKHWWKENNKNKGQKVLDYIFRDDELNAIIAPFGTLTFIGYNYGDSIPDLLEYDSIIMCDISFPKEEMLKLANKFGVSFRWIDHHERTINEVAKYLVDNKAPTIDGLTTRKGELKAACELTWLHFFPNEPMPEIVRLLGRYDCFGHKGTKEEKDVLEFQYGARSCITNYEEAYKNLIHNIKVTFDITEIVDVDYKESIWQSGKDIYKYLCTEAKQTYKNGFEVKFWIDTIPTDEEIRHIPATGICDICGEEENKQLIRYYFRYENDKCNCHSPYHFDIFDCCQYCKPKAKNKVPKRFICINKERFNPINFKIDYHKDGYDGAACFHYANGMWNFSLYNDNGLVDCSVIAKQYGGGGHKGASGFKVNNIEEFLNKHKI